MAPDWDEMAVVARVARPHGLRGEVVLNPETDFPETRFQAGRTLYVRRAGPTEELTLRSSRFQRERPVVAFEGLETIESIESLVGAELRVPADALAPLPDGSYYRHDLVGCVVESRDGARIGPVLRVEGSMVSSLLVVQHGSDEVLIPLVGDICQVVDAAARRIVIDAPEGLLDVNVTRRSMRQTRGRHT